VAPGSERAAVKPYPYWLDTLPAVPGTEAVSGETRELPRQADVVVVGAGYTGLAAARQLAKAGASVVVLEREQVGFGASSRNAGQVLTGLKLDVETLVARYGEAHARVLFDVSVESMATVERIVADERIDCEYERTGHIQAAAKAAHFEAFRREQALLARVFGHASRLVSRAEQRDELGTTRYFGLLVDERSAAINPARYVRGLAAAAVRAGAAIHTGTTVERFSRSTTLWTIVTNRGDIHARDVLFATNGYTNGAAPFLQRRLIPVGSYIVVTAPLGAERTAQLIPKRRMVFDSKHFLYYFRATRDHRLLFGGRAEFSRPSPESTSRAASILRRGLTTIFPDLDDVPIEYAWSGNVAFTRDQMPRAGQIDGVYYAGGYCGHGIAMATHLGGVVARRIAGEPIEHPFMDDTFAPIPLYHGAPWFLPLVGAYYRYRDLID
jgi:glycine/D-amino acid oxidase-like deaminating enzyme